LVGFENGVILSIGKHQAAHFPIPKRTANQIKPLTKKNKKPNKPMRLNQRENFDEGSEMGASGIFGSRKFGSDISKNTV
jgi:hypothetical protein